MENTKFKKDDKVTISNPAGYATRFKDQTGIVIDEKKQYIMVKLDTITCSFHPEELSKI